MMNFKIELCHNNGGVPFISIEHNDILLNVYKDGVYLVGYDEDIFTSTKDIDDLIACLREAKRILTGNSRRSSSPAHLHSEPMLPPPQLGPPCHCLAEMRWDTADGGHWVHVDDSITDHEALPQEQPVIDDTRVVNGSINDLNPKQWYVVPDPTVR